MSSTVLKTLGLGQCISLLIAGTGIFATFLSRAGANYPTILSCMNYCLLSLYLVRVYFRGKECDSDCCSSCTTEQETDQSSSNCNRLDISGPYDKFEGDNVALDYRRTGDEVNGEYEVGDEISRPGQHSHGNGRSGLSIYWYMLAAFLDVQANFLVLLAYNYTSITSIMLLDCFTVPAAMVFSYYFLSYKYTKKHVIGALVCVIGLGFIILGDSVIHSDRSNSIGSSSSSIIFGTNYKKNIDNLVGSSYFSKSNIFSRIGSISISNSNSSSSTSSSSSNSSDGDGTVSRALIGDIICISAAVLYAAANVLQEFIVKTTRDRETYLGRLGAFAAVISFIQFWILDFSNFDNNGFWERDVMLYVLGFVLCLFLMYSLASQFLLKSDATLFNLSLLSSDIYAVVFAFLVFDQRLSFMYLLAFILVAAGLIVYHRESSPRSGLHGSGSSSGEEEECDHTPRHVSPNHTLSSPSNGLHSFSASNSSSPLHMPAKSSNLQSSSGSDIISSFRETLSSNIKKKFLDHGNNYTIISPLPGLESNIDA